ncbi:loganic acid O-methyltransferase-like [Corylus avellana]|uniref:loganic acid O-methyltransferase-like n=1 Tax=Corylus avellana TaxID=13451 RepID=UPI001E21409E|nr:loganic acid O-methyltransferase-like [Corylus avellana]
MNCIPTGISAMKGGDGPYSYTNNSSFQRQGVETAKVLINEDIAEKLDINELISSAKLFNIADLGCSVGPNTIIVVENIIESVKLKYQSFCHNNQGALEFQVFFNDIPSNDFNVLFKSFPSDRQYYAAGVPGLFQGRLFPKASLHFVHCSYALHWLSKIPKELTNKTSPAWNKGRIYPANASDDVWEAYSAQFAKDIESFLNARAQELVSGGLMALIISCLPDGSSVKFFDLGFNDLLEKCLNQMVVEGVVSEDMVDSFNLPQYHPSKQEVCTLIQRNLCFSIERMEPLVRPARKGIAPTVEMVISTLRAVYQEIIAGHFGDDIIDELFDRLKKKVVVSDILSQSTDKSWMLELYVLLKRKVD